MLLATYQHHAAPRGQTTARSGGGRRVEVHGRVPEDASPQAAGARYFAMDAGEDTGQAPAAERPSPLREVGPQAGVGRHGGIGFEPVLSTAVPRVMEDEALDPGVLIFLRVMKEEADEKEEKEKEKVMTRKVTVQEIPEVQGGVPSRKATPQGAKFGANCWTGTAGCSSAANFGVNSEADRRCSRARYSSDANFGANSGADRRGSRVAEYSSEANFEAKCGAERR